MADAMRRGRNPFEEFDLDPSDGIAKITQRLKALAEEAADEAERERIRAAWEALVRHPRGRLRAAFFAHPETRTALGSPPSRARSRGGRSAPAPRDLVVRPRVLRALAEDVGAGSAEIPSAEVDVSLDDDPELRGPS
jgi:hypothetical protein